MDDDNGDWFTSADESEAEPATTTTTGTVGDAAAATSSGGGATDAPGATDGGSNNVGGAADEEAADDGEYLDPDKLLLFKHWIRPKCIPYKYIHNYRRSYYDNVVEVIERRRKGLRGTIPRPQTWAERILRIYNDPYYKIESFDRYLDDIKLVTKSEISGRFYNQHNIENFNKRYSRLVY